MILGQTKHKLILTVALLCAATVLFFFKPAHWWTPRCIVKTLTSLDCPGCGIQRFTHAFLHGDFIEAFSYNYFLLYSLPYLFAVYIIWLLPDSGTKDKLKCIFENKYALWLYLVLYFVWFVVRNILGI